MYVYLLINHNSVFKQKSTWPANVSERYAAGHVSERYAAGHVSARLHKENVNSNYVTEYDNVTF